MIATPLSYGQSDELSWKFEDHRSFSHSNVTRDGKCSPARDRDCTSVVCREEIRDLDPGKQARSGSGLR
jgi:hypothetical protein